jgi:hypothetical protein
MSSYISKQICLKYFKPELQVSANEWYMKCVISSVARDPPGTGQIPYVLTGTTFIVPSKKKTIVNVILYLQTNLF